MSHGFAVPEDVIEDTLNGLCPSCGRELLDRDFDLLRCAYRWFCAGKCCDNEAMVTELELRGLGTRNMRIMTRELAALVWARWIGARAPVKAEAPASSEVRGSAGKLPR